MKYNICSISFRHELVSFRELFQYARDVGFSGIELWGVHARSLRNAHNACISEIVDELAENGMGVTMISDYLDLHASSAQYPAVLDKLNGLIDIAGELQTDKIRIFAGSKGSQEASAREWQEGIDRLRQMAALADEQGIQLVVETHPGTFADSLSSTLALLHEVGHEGLRINFDFLHVWESGADVREAYHALKPWIVNFHFKNISSRAQLGVFAPLNVYSPQGTRDGITTLADGAIDYADVVRLLAEEETPHSASLEWFGPLPYHELKQELAWLQEVESRYQKQLLAKER